MTNQETVFSTEKAISISKTSFWTIILIALIAIAVFISVFIYLATIRDVELYLANKSKDIEMSVYIWENGKKRSAFRGGPNLPGDGKNYESILKPGNWIEIKAIDKTKAPGKSNYYSSLSFDFNEHHLIASRYEVFSIADTISRSLPDTVMYRFKIDGKVRLDYLSFLSQVKLFITNPFMADPFGINQVYIHVTGHVCKPNPNGPPSQGC